MAGVVVALIVLVFGGIISVPGGSWVVSLFSSTPHSVAVNEEAASPTASGPTGPYLAPPELTIDQRINNACELFPTVPTAESVARSMEALRSTLGAWSHAALTETLLIDVCRFPMVRVMSILQSFETELETSLKNARVNWCWHGSAYAQALTTLWTPKESVLWYQRCTALFASALVPPPKSVPSTPRASSPPPTAPAVGEDDDSDAAKKVCPGFRAVSAKYSSIASGKASDAELIAYGRGLAACGPDQKPWEIFSGETGRSGFIQMYVFPYINRDGTRLQDAASYATIAHAWQFD